MKKTLLALAMAVSAFAAQAAAVTGTLTIDGFEHSGAPVATMTVNPPGLFNSQSTTFAVGGLNVSFDDGSGFADSYLAYCIELFAPTANFGKATSYTMNSLPALAPFSTAFSTSQESRLTKLFVKNSVANGTSNGGSLDAQGSAAMQLAIWEIMYDDNNFGDLSAGLFGFGAGEFYSTSAAGARTAAENLIAGLDGYDTTGYAVGFASFNNGGNKSGKQDFLTANVTQTFGCNEGDCGGNPVPEPGSMALAGLALAGLAYTSRRKSRKAA